MPLHPAYAVRFSAHQRATNGHHPYLHPNLGRLSLANHNKCRATGAPCFGVVYRNLRQALCAAPCASRYGGRTYIGRQRTPSIFPLRRDSPCRVQGVDTIDSARQILDLHHFRVLREWAWGHFNERRRSRRFAMSCRMAASSFSAKAPVSENFGMTRRPCCRKRR